MVIYGEGNREDKDTVRIAVGRLEKKARPKKGQRMKFGCKREVKVLLEKYQLRNSSFSGNISTDKEVIVILRKRHEED